MKTFFVWVSSTFVDLPPTVLTHVSRSNIKFVFSLFLESESCSVMSTLCEPTDYTVYGILQARILEWVAFPFSRGSCQPRIEPRSPTLQADSLPAEPPGKLKLISTISYKHKMKEIENIIFSL